MANWSIDSACESPSVRRTRWTPSPEHWTVRPGEWLLGRTGSEGSTVFAYGDGVALPQVALSHGATPPALWGVTDNQMVLLAGGAPASRWAILSVPLDLVAADISLSHTNPDGTLLRDTWRGHPRDRQSVRP